jgi:dihydrolipoamide dehydrogenase
MSDTMKIEKEYDIIIIGGGPGGYVAAERAGAAGKKVLLIEKDELGGVCLNWGCIPTKSLLNSAKYYHHALHGDQFGVKAESVSYNLETAMAWKEKTVKSLRGGVAFLMKREKVDTLKGTAKIVERKIVEVDGARYRGDFIIIATGSSPAVPPIPGSDGPTVLTSNQVLEIKKLPSSIAVIGGGVIGMEFASWFSTLGVKTTVIEMLEEILPMMDRKVASGMRKALPGINFHLGSKVEKIEPGKVSFSTSGSQESCDAEMVLLATGRRPNLSGLGLEEMGIDFNRTGIKTDCYQKTNIPGIYAAGDVTGKSQLAHSASRMGEVAVGHILDPASPRFGRMRYNAVPWAVYTLPEAAGCGYTEAAALEAGLKVRTATSHFAANGRFLAEKGKGPGFCNVVINAETGVLLGVHLLGAYSSEIIHSAAAMIEAELRDIDIKEIIFPHPTVSEVIREAIWELKEK